ncbi:hypothetical protein Pmani_030571 [Petrolisthes manimaculis]|uniref:CCD97-like C-terminal domain-containing protein n=1 Tax=Petrolisthes manimaculis TaxID=1843537 RepID=A0AAE1NX41_9EUCA|nr:hypothetical protein Pmani_030571 [Petrolisthes manimaculis]
MWGEFEDDYKETSDKRVKKCVKVKESIGSGVRKENDVVSTNITTNITTTNNTTTNNTTNTNTTNTTPVHQVDDDKEACVRIAVSNHTPLPNDLLHHSPPPPPPPTDTLLNLPLCDRLLHHLASSSVTVKSQQRYEPDLTYQERRDILSTLLQHKPAQFLYRFGKHLEREHLQYFVGLEDDPEVDHYITETQKHLNAHTAKIRVRNRRYAALERLRRQGEYFSEEEMERRDPLLYHQLIAKHQTEQERNQKQSAVNKPDISFSSILLEHIDMRAHKDLQKQQEEEEDNMFEEGDSDEEVEEEEEQDDDGEEREGHEGEKRLYREEFYSACYSNFLGGRHTDFDYGKVDASDEYDLLEIRARDEEESYFDQESSNDSLTQTTTTTNNNNQSPGQNSPSHDIMSKHKSSISNPTLSEDDGDRVVEEMDDDDECGGESSGKQMTTVNATVNTFSPHTSHQEQQQQQGGDESMEFS